MIAVGRRVLVTRPEPGASETAARLADAGFVPLILPLSETFGLVAAIPDQKFDAVAITSANAVRHCPPVALERLKHLPCFVVGEATAAIARDAGLDDLHVGDGFGLSLAKIVAAELRPGTKILYLTGKVRSPDFERVLAEARIDVYAVEVYDTAEVSYTTDIFNAITSRQPIDITVVYSAFGAGVLSALMANAESSHLFDNTQFLCISRRVSDALSTIDQQRKHVSATPDEEAMFKRLAELAR